MSEKSAASKVSYNVQEAAAQTGVSVDVIRRAIRSGLLVAHYPTSRPIVMHDDLVHWLSSSPLEAAS